MKKQLEKLKEILETDFWQNRDTGFPAAGAGSDPVWRICPYR